MWEIDASDVRVTKGIKMEERVKAFSVDTLFPSEGACSSSAKKTQPRILAGPRHRNSHQSARQAGST